MIRDYLVHTLLQCVGAKRVSSAYLVWGKRGGPTQVAQKGENKFPIGKQESNEETLSAPQELPRVSAFPRTVKRKRQLSWREVIPSPATNLPALMTSVYSGRCVSQGPNPLLV